MEEAGRIRRGYFIAGLGGAQFALPGAVDRLRSFRDASMGEEGGRRRPLALAATDPANPYGVALSWPDPVGDMPGRPTRVAGAYVVLIDGGAALFVERRGRGIVALRAFDGTWEASAVEAIVGLVGDGRPFARLIIESGRPPNSTPFSVPPASHRRRKVGPSTARGGRRRRDRGDIPWLPARPWSTARGARRVRRHRRRSTR